MSQSRNPPGISRAASRYAYDRSFAPYVVPGAISLAHDDLPDARWFGLMLQSQARALVGATAIRARHRVPSWLVPDRVRRGLSRIADAVVPDAPGRVASAGDSELAWLRFAGTNPFQIRRARRLEDVSRKLRLSDAIVAELLGPGATLTERIARGDVFTVAYDELAVGAPDELQAGKWVAPVGALFCHAPGVEAPFPVVPLAIDCAPGRAGSDTVVTPLAGERWSRAKAALGVADVNASELCVHLARAHFMTVPFAIALRRTVPSGHPLRRFLLPHLRFNLFVDRMAWQQGVRGSDGVLVKSLAGSASWSQRVAKSVHAGLSFRDQHFERDLEARGLADHPVEYPYRDDGRLLWGAIRRFAGAWVDATWARDEELGADEVLAAFIAELRDPAGGNVRGLLAGDRLESRDELAEILAQVIFVAGPLHALAHYGSAAQLQHVEDNPSWLVASPLASDAAVRPRELAALAQWRRVVSTNCQYDRLGDFSRHALGRDARSAPFVAAFRDDLASIERTIEERNRRRPGAFIHFLPSRISNGITV